MLVRNSKFGTMGLRRLRILSALILFGLIISSSTVFGQRSRNETPPLRERLFYGGSFGLQFGTYTDIDISPVVGLWVLPRLNIAAGPKYRYLKYYEERANIFGGRAYTQFFVIRDINNIIPINFHLGLFLHAEDEFFKVNYTDGIDTEELFINAPLVGAGISEPLGRRSSLNVMVLWALEDDYDFYSDPEIRISIIF
jgi:hypothetical protein